MHLTYHGETPDGPERDRSALEAINVTPSMIEAGIEAMFGVAHLRDGDSATEIAEEVYRAMEIARRMSIPGRLCKTA